MFCIFFIIHRKNNGSFYLQSTNNDFFCLKHLLLLCDAAGLFNIFFKENLARVSLPLFPRMVACLAYPVDMFPLTLLIAGICHPQPQVFPPFLFWCIFYFRDFELCFLFEVAITCYM